MPPLVLVLESEWGLSVWSAMSLAACSWAVTLSARLTAHLRVRRHRLAWSDVARRTLQRMRQRLAAPRPFPRGERYQSVGSERRSAGGALPPAHRDRP